MAEYQPASSRPLAPPSNASDTRCGYPTPSHGACLFDAPGDIMASAPLSPVECVILGIAGVWLGTVAVIACRLACRSRRRGREEDRESLQTLVGTPPRPLILPTLREKEHDWSASAPTRSNTFNCPSNKFGTLRLPAACLRDNGYTRLRDIVPCRTLGGLGQSDADRLPAQPVSARTPHVHPLEVEAEVATRGSPTISDPDLTLSYPEWVRPYLPSFREQAKQEWNVYHPQTGLVAVSSISPSSSSSRAATPFPVIVIQSCNDNDAPSTRPDSPDSVYSVTEDFSYEDVPSIPVSSGSPLYTPCLILRSRGGRGSLRGTDAVDDKSPVVLPTSPDTASPVSFYFPTTPTLSEGTYLQVPSTSDDSPTDIEGIDDAPRQTQSNYPTPPDLSGETVVLHRTTAFKAKDAQDSSRDIGIALTSDTSFGAGRGLVMRKTIDLGLSSDLWCHSGAGDMQEVRGDIPLDFHRWLAREDDSSQDSTIRFSDVLGHFRCSVEVLTNDSVYSDTSLVSNSSSDRIGTEDSADYRLHEIIDLYRRRDTDDDTSNLRGVLDGWVKAVTCKDGLRMGLGPNLPYGPPRSDYVSEHSAV